MNDDNRNYYFQNADFLTNKYAGRFIVISNQEVFGDYATSDEAYNAAISELKLGSFYIVDANKTANSTLISNSMNNIVGDNDEITFTIPKTLIVISFILFIIQLCIVFIAKEDESEFLKIAINLFFIIGILMFIYILVRGVKENRKRIIKLEKELKKKS